MKKILCILLLCLLTTLIFADENNKDLVEVFQMMIDEDLGGYVVLNDSSRFNIYGVKEIYETGVLLLLNYHVHDGVMLYVQYKDILYIEMVEPV